MPDLQAAEPIPQAEPVIDPAAQVEGQVADPVEPPVEGAPAEPSPDEQFLVKTVVDGEERVFDIRDQAQRDELVETAQKGFHFTKKSQALSAWEQSKQQELQMAQQLLSNQDAVKMLVANQMGYDPMMVLGQPVVPDETMRETNPIEYGRQYGYYQLQVDQQRRFNDAVQRYNQQVSTSANFALFERARVTHNLNDQEYQEVQRVVVSDMRPNAMGTYSDRQIEAAIRAVTGRERESKNKLDQSNKVQQALKNATKTPARQASARPPILNDAQKKEKEYTEYVKSSNVR